MALDSNLLKEAIADAKAVRQTALANAKVALEEAFSEKYHAMFAEKLKEDAAQTDVVSGNLPGAPDVKQGAPEENVSEQEIDELIKELESEVGAPGAPGAPDSDDLAGAETPPSDAGAGAPPMGAPPMGAPAGGQMVMCPVGTVATADMPPAPAPGAPPMGAPMGAPPMGAPPMGAPPMGAPPVDAAPPTPPPSDVPPTGEEQADEDINLDELLESLKAEVEEEEKLDEDKKLASSGIATSDNKKPSSVASSTSAIESGGAKKDGYPSGDAKQIASDPTDASRPNQGKNATSTNLSTPSAGGSSGPALKAARPNSKGDFENTAKLTEENEALKKQLNESETTIRYVKTQLNEINLLNAKLLYTNKLFKEYGMNNEHKMRIVEMFDLAKTVREVKLTYANIAESLNFGGTDKRKVKTSANVQSITEGLASQPVGGTKPTKEIISESKSSQMVTRFQQIAGIKPTKK
jgi:hypothetical protein